jgi:flagellar FliL protein
MAEEDKDTASPAESGGGLTKKLMFAGIGLALLGAGVFGGMTFFGGDAPAEDAAAGEEAVATGGPALYTSLHPPLVVNFRDSIGDSHFMQITMEVMARDQNIINAVRDHTPVIRNALILLYSGAIYEEITTREGKEKMLADGLAEIQGVLTEQIGEPGIEAVYFTALVIQ